MVRAIYTSIYLFTYTHIHIRVCIHIYTLYIYICVCVCVCTSDWQSSKLSDTDERSGEIGTIILLCKAH